MNNILIFSDLHIKEHELQECSSVLDEILSLSKEYKISQVYDLGDIYDNLQPNSQEFNLFANFIKKLNLPITILAANSHESESNSTSIVDHFGVLNEMVQIVKEFKDGTDMYLGHFYIKESKKGRFGATVSKDDLKQYKKIFLGHQHSFEKIDNVVQLGSCRSISFDESEDENKYVCIIQNYKEKDEKITYLPLKSPISMQTVYLGGSLSNDAKKALIARNSSQLRAILDKIEPNCKVRIVFQDFEEYKEFLPFYKTYADKFVLFKSKMNFIVTAKEEVKKEKIPFKNILDSWMDKNKIDKDIRTILLEEIQ